MVTENSFETEKQELDLSSLIESLDVTEENFFESALKAIDEKEIIKEEIVEKKEDSALLDENYPQKEKAHKL